MTIKVGDFVAYKDPCSDSCIRCQAATPNNLGQVIEVTNIVVLFQGNDNKLHRIYTQNLTVVDPNDIEPQKIKTEVWF